MISVTISVDSNRKYSVSLEGELSGPRVLMPQRHLTSIIEVLSKPFSKNHPQNPDAWTIEDEASKPLLVSLMKVFMSPMQQSQLLSSADFIDALADFKQLRLAISMLIRGDRTKEDMSLRLRFKVLTSPGVRAAFERHSPDELENLMEGMSESQREDILRAPNLGRSEVGTQARRSVMGFVTLRT